MQVELDQPELEQFIAEEVRAGRYESPQAAIAAAVECMMRGRSAFEPDSEALAAIEEAEQQLDRDDGIPLEAAFSELRARHLK